jgi:hypothetical protein
MDYSEIFIGLLILFVSYKVMQVINFNDKVINKKEVE